MQPVKINIALHALTAAEPRRIDGHKGLAVHLEADVDAVAGGAWNLTDNHPFGPRQRIDEGALADVPPSGDGHFHLGLVQLLPAFQIDVR